MTMFQIACLTVLSATTLVEIRAIVRGSRDHWFRLGRTLVWCAAGVAIAVPDIIQRSASLVGIGRGTDLVLYLFILAFVCVSFYFYSKYISLQRQITLLVRQRAIAAASFADQEVGLGKTVKEER